MADKTKEEASFAERQTALEQREAALTERETTITTRETAAAESALAARHEGNVAFAEALIAGGKLAPAGKGLVVIALDGLDATTTVSFGEGEVKQDLTPLAALKKLFDGAGTIVAFGEHAAPKGDLDAKQDPQAIADRAVAFAEEQRKLGREITIAAAVRHVSKEAD